MFCHLHTRSCFSFLQGGSHPAALVAQAALQKQSALALCDVHGVYGIVKFQREATHAGIKPICGAELRVDGSHLVLLARNNEGYTQLNRLLSSAHFRSREEPGLDLPAIAQHELSELLCLSGGYRSHLRLLLRQRKQREAAQWLTQLQQLFGSNLYAEMSHHCRPGENAELQNLHRIATELEIKCVASGDVLYAQAEDYRSYDIMTCIKHGITVFDDHEERAVNAEAYLKSATQMRALIPYEDALLNTMRIAEICSVNVLATHITPPAARLEAGENADDVLRSLCEGALPKRYAIESNTPILSNDATIVCNERAVQLLEKELEVIASLELSDYFLVVKEVVDEAKRRGIRCSGRGSAANSIVAYLLGITGVDPVRHRLLFERFLHGGRKGTPDIDVDFDSERREEVIAWMEERFGVEQTAMTATLMCYRLRSALRDVCKALGYPISVVDKIGKSVPSSSARSVRKYLDDLSDVVPTNTPLFRVALSMVESLSECPRHLGLHSGGMLLSRTPLTQFSAIQVSANGVKEVQFDKNDVEAMGLVKLDVLGLRMLATVSEAVELIASTMGVEVDIDELSLDDPKVYELMCSSRTIGLFQIESQGQQHVLAIHQPSTFDDLIAEVALFRPGPLQSGMVNPYIRRRRGQEAVDYLHPDLKGVLGDTYGVILFQEQVLEIAHHFAGMSLAQADDFRSLMSKFRDSTEMELMRGKFVEGAMNRGVDEVSANKVFDTVSYFVGYGFCRSHAAAFAKIVYQSAWLKLYYPAAYMAAVMQHRPGFYSLMTLIEETKRFGVEVLLPDVNRSGIRYGLEQRMDHTGAATFAIRKPLCSIDGLTEEVARSIVMERLRGPFISVEDFVRRIDAHRDVIECIARSGALDAMAVDARDALWQAGVALNRRSLIPKEQTLFDLPLVQDLDIPRLPELLSTERLAWDYTTHHSARVHPMTLYRRMLNDLEVRTIETCYRMPGNRDLKKAHTLMIGGIATLRQQPGTAKGVMFLTLEDETGYIQTIVLPHIKEKFRKVLRSSALIVKGKLEGENGWRGLLVQDVWVLQNVQGGYTGFPSQTGGKDSLIVQVPSTTPELNLQPLSHKG